MIQYLYIAWQANDTRRWYPIGCLTSVDSAYQFQYTFGAVKAREEAGFNLLPSFPMLEAIYEADKLFPIFANRLLPRSRPEYLDFVRWLDVSEEEESPLALLARSAGRKVTDNWVVFPCPEKDENRQYVLHFFPHGLRHMPQSSIDRAKLLKKNEQLLLMHDFQNPKDLNALMLRTAELGSGDGYNLGYIPRYLVEDVMTLLKGIPDLSQLKVVLVEKVNPPPAPIQYRVLCKLTLPWLDGFQPFAGELFQPLSERKEAPEALSY